LNTVAKIILENHIRAKQPKKLRFTTDSNHAMPLAENQLDRRFDPSGPNKAWVADITYIPNPRYLVAVEDLNSRRIVCWSM
jgi:transposase InsO family protein